MRLIYIEPDDRQALDDRAQVFDQIDAFWDAFKSKYPSIQSQFQQGNTEDAAAFFSDNLHAIDSDLMWEFGGSESESSLVITPEAERQLRPLVRAIVERAPAIEGLTVLDARVGEPDAIETTVLGRTGFDIAGAVVEPSTGEHNRLDLALYAPGMRGSGDRVAMLGAVVGAEAALGEKLMDHWVGSVRAYPTRAGAIGRLFGRAPKVPQDAFPLASLPSLVNAHREFVLNARPEAPLGSFADATWSAVSFSPRKAIDYAHLTDLIACSTPMPELLNAALLDIAFYSSKFSAHNEQFCFLKIEHKHIGQDNMVAFRQDIEDRVGAALLESELGTTWGGGGGVRYVYVFLAFRDVMRALETIRVAVEGCDIPKRAWLMFFDTELSVEWLGLRPDADTPPM